MKKLIITLSILFTLTGCEQGSSHTNVPTNVNKYIDISDSIQLLCIEGVEYYRNMYGIAPVVDKDTLTYKTCEK